VARDTRETISRCSAVGEFGHAGLFVDSVFGVRTEITQGADRDRDSAHPMTSPCTSYRLNNRHCAGAAKNSDEKQVIVSPRKATTKGGEQGKRNQLPQA
jgi:hypothetical protein